MEIFIISFIILFSLVTYQIIETRNEEKEVKKAIKNTENELI